MKDVPVTAAVFPHGLVPAYPGTVTLISKRGGMLESGVLPLTLGQRVVVLRYRRLPWPQALRASPRWGFLAFAEACPAPLRTDVPRR